MNKKYLIFIFIFVTLLIFNSRCYASSINEIKDCIVTVEPKMSDGTLEITYEITLKILELNRDSLQYIYLDAPNSLFKSLTALSDNIKSINKYKMKSIKIFLDREYYEGEEIAIKYSIEQYSMYNISWGKCKYLFIPESFTDSKINNITVRWNLNDVIYSNASSQDGNYLIWNKIDNDKYVKIKVDYDKTSFSNLNKLRQRKYIFTTGKVIFVFVVIIILACVACILGYSHVHVNNVRKFRFYRYYIR